jgi:hypothetical protein
LPREYLKERGFMSNARPSGNISAIVRNRELVVRQDRLILAGDNAFLTTNVGKFEVVDLSTFGLSIMVTDAEMFNDELEATLSYHDIEVASFIGRKVRSERVSHNSWKVALEIIGNSVDVDSITAIRAAEVISRDHQTTVEKFEKVSPEFRKIVYEMKDWLESLKHTVNSREYKYNFSRSFEFQIVPFSLLAL